MNASQREMNQSAVTAAGRWLISFVALVNNAGDFRRWQ
jgi:hypothetical protein